MNEKKKYLIELTEHELINMQNEAFNDFMSDIHKAQEAQSRGANAIARRYRQKVYESLDLWNALCGAVPQDWK